MRESGILMHISSLPSEYGIGSLGRCAYEFVDFLKKAGQSRWQVLPVGPTGYGDSPYRPYSCFAGNPYFIDLELLAGEGLLTREELARQRTGGGPVDYGRLYHGRYALLEKAFRRFDTGRKDFVRFCTEQRDWLDDYGMYAALNRQFGCSWHSWPRRLAGRQERAMNRYSREHSSKIVFYKFLQFLFFKQWRALKKYANSNGIKIIGDLPIYASDDSSDVWSHPELFKIGQNLELKSVAGVPPDAFSRDGQLWGNPVYDWPVHRRQGFSWWKRRIDAALDMYDIIRLDHFRGFESYWEVPADAASARRGSWQPGPGEEFFLAAGLTGSKRVIAEDLGVITPQVRSLLEKCAFPGMKILQFAFNPDENSNDGAYLPHSIPENSVVYTGTHDNPPTARWWENEPDENKKFFLQYGAWDSGHDICGKMITLAFMSRAKLALIPMQDWLGLGRNSRMNRPSTSGGNWIWRAERGQLTDALAEKIKKKASLYRRRRKE